MFAEFNVFSNGAAEVGEVKGERPLSVAVCDVIKV